MSTLTTDTMSVTIGADPEVFLKQPDGLVMPACGLIGGNKANPEVVHLGAVQEDNVMAEFNIDPCLTVTEFVRNINTVYGEITRRAGVHGLEVAARASADFPMFLLQMHPQALEFGCEPDFNAYTREENPTPDIMSTLRTCAGHVHMGFEHTDPSQFSMACGVVEYLDWIVGCWTVLYDPDTTRRERYGKAGAFRPKPYGLEYRVPSNFWLGSEDLMSTMFNRVRLAYGLAKSDSDKPDPQEVVNAINTHDTDACHRLLGRYAA